MIQLTWPTVHVYTDASGCKGLRGVFGPHWFSSCVPCKFRDCDIQFKEIYAILQAILHWGDLWSNHHVVFHIDNSAIVQALTTETNHSHLTMLVVLLIAMLAAFLHSHFLVHGFHLSNTLADAASCFQYAHPFKFAPSLNHQNYSISCHTTGIRHMLNFCCLLCSSSGMALPPACSGPIAPANAHTLTSCHSTITCSS